MTGVILPVKLFFAVNIAEQLHWFKINSKTESLDHLKHDPLAAVHLGAKLLVVKQL
jgi:hypothetical protein